MRGNKAENRLFRLSMHFDLLSMHLLSIGTILVAALGCSSGRRGEVEAISPAMETFTPLRTITIDDPGTSYSVSEIETLIGIRLPSDLPRSKMLFYTDYDNGGPDYICCLKIFAGVDVLESLIGDERWESRGEDEFMLKRMDFSYRPQWWKPMDLSEYCIYDKQGAGEVWNLAYGTDAAGTQVIYVVYIDM